jgi:hypothetical protein
MFKGVIASKSSLSYAAGLISDNIVYHNKSFWHPPKRNWKLYLSQ